MKLDVDYIGSLLLSPSSTEKRREDVDLDRTMAADRRRNIDPTFSVKNAGTRHWSTYLESRSGEFSEVSSQVCRNVFPLIPVDGVVVVLDTFCDFVVLALLDY